MVIADDDAFARRLIKRALQARGMTVVAEAKDGREAVEFGLVHRPDVVVLDVVMPGLDGVLATQRILSAEPDLLVVALTGAGEDELGLAALRAGAVAVVPKDVDLDAWLAQSKARAEGSGRSRVQRADAAPARAQSGGRRA